MPQSKRLMRLRWRRLLTAEKEGAAWMEKNRPVLRRALAEIYRDDLLALYWLRTLLIIYYA